MTTKRVMISMTVIEKRPLEHWLGVAGGQMLLMLIIVRDAKQSLG